ncbi:MAG: hypothetical protein J6M91_03630 [Methanobrevibacter sp.]|nr:hypothetical protein [Methanobrevibacter sp.]
MTERFTNDGKLIMQNGEVWTVAHTRIDADVIAESLNILIKKNEQLEREYNKLKHRHSLLHDECLTVEHAKEGLEKDVLVLERENAQLIQGNEKLKKYNKGQELEIVRLHNLADAMSGVLRELGIYDVYNDEQIENVKRRLND